MKKGVKVVLGVLVGLGVVGSFSGGGTDKVVSSTKAGTEIVQSSNVNTNVSTTKPVSTKPVSTKPVVVVTRGEENALKKAESYLRYSAFSKKGLKDQLEFEGFSGKEIDYALKNIVVDWNEQAALKAESYLKYSSFSKSSLLDQLLFEGFTQSQAEYGVDKVY